MTEPLRRYVLRILTISCVVFATVVMAQVRASDQAATADKLVASDWKERREALTTILKTPAEQRSPRVIEAVAREMARLQPVIEAGGEFSGDPSVSWEYYTDLIDVACESRNPIVLVPLTNAIETGAAVSKAVARFGEPAVPHLLRVMRTRLDPSVDVSALRSLELIVIGTPTLSPTARGAIGDIALEHLTGRQYSPVVRRAIALTVALHEFRALPFLDVLAEPARSQAEGLRLVDQALINMDDLRSRAKDAAAKIRGAK